MRSARFAVWCSVLPAVFGFCQPFADPLGPARVVILANKYGCSEVFGEDRNRLRISLLCRLSYTRNHLETMTYEDMAKCGQPVVAGQRAAAVGTGGADAAGVSATVFWSSSSRFPHCTPLPPAGAKARGPVSRLGYDAQAADGVALLGGRHSGVDRRRRVRVSVQVLDVGSRDVAQPRGEGVAVLIQRGTVRGSPSGWRCGWPGSRSASTRHRTRRCRGRRVGPWGPCTERHPGWATALCAGGDGDVRNRVVKAEVLTSHASGLWRPHSRPVHQLQAYPRFDRGVSLREDGVDVGALTQPGFGGVRGIGRNR